MKLTIVASLALCAFSVMSQAQTKIQPELSEADSQHMRAIIAEAQLMQTRAEVSRQSLISERSSLIARIEKEHPGYHWVDDQNSPTSGRLEANSDEHAPTPVGKVK